MQDINNEEVAKKLPMKFKSLEALYFALASAFCVIVVMSNIISAKMVRLPFFDFSIPAGVVTYPLSFFLSDLITEIFGPKRAKQMVYVTFAMSFISFGMIELALILPADKIETQRAFQAILGLSGLRIFSSLIAYGTSQLADIQLYALIKRWTGPRFLWLRNNLSVCLSQMIDTFLVDMIFLYWGLGIALPQVGHIMLFSYLYKALFSVVCTPAFYFSVFAIKRKYEGIKNAMRASQTAIGIENQP
jgi:queuosine precursor transporter